MRGCPTTLLSRAIALRVAFVIGTGPKAGDALDDPFHLWKEADAVQQLITPARRDAVMPVVGTGVMTSMRGAAEQHAAVLQHANEPWW